MFENNQGIVLSPMSFVKYSLDQKLKLFSDFDTALICLDPTCYVQIKKSYPGTKLTGLTGEAHFLEGKSLLLGGFVGIGAPAAVAFTEELIACGIKRFIFLGTAGRLNDTLQAGDMVICKATISEEGTSKCYPDWRQESDSASKLTAYLSEHFQNRQIYLTPVKTWTTDAPYMETTEKLNHYLSLGANVVEMEASARNAVAHFRKVEMAQIFVISDSLARGVWEPYFNSDVVQNNLRQVAVDLVKLFSK